MALKDLNIKISYTSQGEGDILKDFLIPSLKEAVIYKRSVGFFSSSVFELLGVGLKQFINNGGTKTVSSSTGRGKENYSGLNKRTPY